MPRPKAPSLQELGRYLPELLTTSQAAEFLQLSQDHLRVLLRAGELRGVRVTGSWRIPRDVILERLEPAGGRTSGVRAATAGVRFSAANGPNRTLQRCPILLRDRNRSRSAKRLRSSRSARRRSVACSPAERSPLTARAARAARHGSPSMNAGRTSCAHARDSARRSSHPDAERSRSPPGSQRQDRPPHARPWRPDRHRRRRTRRRTPRPPRPKTGHPPVRFCAPKIGHSSKIGHPAAVEPAPQPRWVPENRTRGVPAPTEQPRGEAPPARQGPPVPSRSAREASAPRRARAVPARRARPAHAAPSGRARASRGSAPDSLPDADRRGGDAGHLHRDRGDRRRHTRARRRAPRASAGTTTQQSSTPASIPPARGSAARAPAARGGVARRVAIAPPQRLPPHGGAAKIPQGSTPFAPALPPGCDEITHAQGLC